MKVRLISNSDETFAAECQFESCTVQLIKVAHWVEAIDPRNIASSQETYPRT